MYLVCMALTRMEQFQRTAAEAYSGCNFWGHLQSSRSDSSARYHKDSNTRTHRVLHTNCLAREVAGYQTGEYHESDSGKQLHIIASRVIDIDSYNIYIYTYFALVVSVSCRLVSVSFKNRQFQAALSTPVSRIMS